MNNAHRKPKAKLPQNIIWSSKLWLKAYEPEIIILVTIFYKLKQSRKQDSEIQDFLKFSLENLNSVGWLAWKLLFAFSKPICLFYSMHCGYWYARTHSNTVPHNKSHHSGKRRQENLTLSYHDQDGKSCCSCQIQYTKHLIYNS